jgi:acyl carrier protein
MKTKVEETVFRVISELTAIEPEDINPEDRLRGDLGLDSVSSMELLSMLAEEFDVDVEIEEVVRVTTVSAVIELVKRSLPAKA